MQGRKQTRKASLIQYNENLTVHLKKSATVDQEGLRDAVVTLFQKEDFDPGCLQDHSRPQHKCHAVKVLQKDLMPNHFHFLGYTFLVLGVLTLELLHHQRQDLTEALSRYFCPFQDLDVSQTTGRILQILRLI
jgi:hypothetical protein